MAGLTDDWLELTLDTADHMVRLAVAPLVAGGAARVVRHRPPGIGSLVGRLARDWATEVTADGRESLEVTLG